jgi:hydroxymethylpyrimidine/phosphomethylpyrimidine kinase
MARAFRSRAAHPVTVVTIAASDSGGGAGIQADLLVFAAHGVHGATVLTGGTAQNTRAFSAVQPFSPRFIAAQMDAVFPDFRPRAVKIGALLDAGRIRAVGDGLRRHRAVNVVLDPVLRASSGGDLLPLSALATLEREIVPLCDVVTPNIPEAAALAGIPIRSERDVAEAAERISRMGARAVLVKGGHSRSGTVHDRLFEGGRMLAIAHPRVATRATHGTGCMLSSAIAANLARGCALESAVARAIEYVHAGLSAGFFPGRGRGIPDHFPRSRSS